jgi:peroxiredoxin
MCHPISRRLMLSSCFLAALAASAVSARADDKLKIGDSAPDWKDLTGVDDRRYALADLHDQQVVVMCFTCNSCPYSVDYEDRLIALFNRYKDHPAGISLIAVNSNRKPSETLEKMKERAKEREFPFPYVIDETQEIGNKFGAVFTPEFFVLNRDRKVIYIGAMDDKTDPQQATVNYVELAIEAALKGDLPQTTEVPARGCTIPYRRARK